MKLQTIIPFHCINRVAFWPIVMEYLTELLKVEQMSGILYVHSTLKFVPLTRRKLISWRVVGPLTSSIRLAYSGGGGANKSCGNTPPCPSKFLDRPMNV